MTTIRDGSTSFILARSVLTRDHLLFHAHAHAITPAHVTDVSPVDGASVRQTTFSYLTRITGAKITEFHVTRLRGMKELSAQNHPLAT